jgi:GH15 family glucan-1,4-alpha-glucosidase
MDDVLPVKRTDGYLPIQDHGLIGDGATAALVGRDGAISWLCVPRFDSPPLFCSILDPERGGRFTVAPEGHLKSAQRYEEDTGVLVTEMQTVSGSVRVTDAMTLHSGADLAEDAAAARGELLRRVEVLEGEVRLRVEILPRGGGNPKPTTGGIRIGSGTFPHLDLTLASPLRLDGLQSAHSLRKGDRVFLLLRWAGGSHQHALSQADQRLEETIDVWRRWAQHISYGGPQRDKVRRSAITLKLLDHFENGAIVAAPTSSLPGEIGGTRNWDYRYSWVRDAAFSVYALRRIGLREEARGFLGWVLDAVERGGWPKALYTLDGKEVPGETVDRELRGYRDSRPVRWGNAANAQVQHDVYGEILDCAHQWSSGGGGINSGLWSRLRPLVEAARSNWRDPDRSVWEVRTADRPFTYSAALCHVALDRAARIAERFGHVGDVQGWRVAARDIREVILEDAWNPEAGAITQHLGGAELDASVLALPLRRVIPADHPKMEATTAAVRERLGAGNGLIYRYLPDRSPDGLPGKEGGFVLCSFWLVDNLAWQGRLEEATELYERLCDRTNRLGLLPEQIDPGSGTFLGNYPQAFSHVGLISSGVTLDRLWRGMVDELEPGARDGPIEKTAGRPDALTGRQMTPPVDEEKPEARRGRPSSAKP